MKDSLVAATAASAASSPNKAKGGNSNGEVIFDDQTGFNVNVANKLNLSGRKAGGEDADKKEKKQMVSPIEVG